MTTEMTQVKVAGLELRAMSPTQLIANNWNPNEMDVATYEKTKQSIRENGFIDPILAREVDDLEEGQLEVIDGEHRVRIALELELDAIPVINLGKVERPQAQKLTIITDYLRGRPTPDKLALVAKELSEVQPLSELEATLPYTGAEITALVRTTEQFDWGKIREEEMTPVGNGKRTQHVDTGAEHRRVSIGRIAGTIPTWLVNELAAEFDRTAAARGSTSLEAVFMDWAERLKNTEPSTNERARTGAKSKPAAKKGGGRKPKAQTAAKGEG